MPGQYKCPYCGEDKPHSHEYRLSIALPRLLEQLYLQERLLQHLANLYARSLGEERQFDVLGYIQNTRDRVADVKSAFKHDMHSELLPLEGMKYEEAAQQQIPYRRGPLGGRWGETLTKLTVEELLHEFAHEAIEYGEWKHYSQRGWSLFAEILRHMESGREQKENLCATSVKEYSGLTSGKSTASASAQSAALTSMNDTPTNRASSSEPSGWISVKDRLPEPNRFVLIWSKGTDGPKWDGLYLAACLKLGPEGKPAGWMADLDGMFDVNAFTHWQPLPAPPPESAPPENQK